MSRAVNAFCGMFWPMSETFRRKKLWRHSACCGSNFDDQTLSTGNDYLKIGCNRVEFIFGHFSSDL